MKIGDIYTYTTTVNEQNTAAALGSGALPVFGTPFLIAMMENAAFTGLQKELNTDKSTVGTKICISHVSPTPIGMNVCAEAEIVAISENGKMIDFAVRAFDDAGLIGEGTHQRAIITVERFMAKCEGKRG